jgi:hypothetical protein
MLPFADHSLARRLERTEADANARFVEARARWHPVVGAEWIEVAGAYAMFDGVDSPCTQTFGLGMFAPASEHDLDRIEAFFARHHSPVHHETSPLADPALPQLLSTRGYRPVESSNVLYRSIGLADPFPEPTDPTTTTRLIAPEESALWAAVSLEGWSEFKEYAAVMAGLAEISARRDGGLAFLAERGGQPIATGALSIYEGVGLLAGASTIPSARRHGAQLALLAARLRYASAQECDVAMMVASPGSGSQRNAERHGFRVAYTRTKWGRPAG